MSQAVKSSLGTASQYATQFQRAGDTLGQSATVQMDGQTTLTGNAQAKGAIDAARQSATDVAQAFHAACANIQTVASNFEAVDQEASRTLFDPHLGIK